MNGEWEVHSVAVIRQLNPSHSMGSDDDTTTVSSNPATIIPYMNALLARITFLGCGNTEWLQAQHKAKIQLIFQAKEQQITVIEEVLT